MNTPLMATLAEQLDKGLIVPYLGPGMLALCPEAPVPATPLALAELMTSQVSVPHKIRKRLTQAAQFIENFKHRKSVVHLMNQAFAAPTTPSALPQAPGGAQPILYKPIGAHAPAGNYLVSDSDYVEVLTEIDIQTPIPAAVQAWRSGRHFLFLGCRFDDQLTRSFARQIMKRSSAQHWAVLPDEPTRMEARFLQEQGITRIAQPLASFATGLVEALQDTATA